MKVPEFKKRTAKEIREQLHRLAKTYTPEWRFDPQNPDAGTALALICEEMQEETEQKYAQAAYKNMLEFFRTVHTSLKPSVPAAGYASFGLVNQEVEGAELYRGTKLLGNAGTDNGEDVVFETVNDLYVSPFEVEDVYQVFPSEDGIYHAYSRESAEEGEGLPFALFKGRGENEQRHVLYLSHDYVFYMEREGRIFLKLLGEDKSPLSPESLAAFTDGQRIEYAYSTESGFEPFARVEVKNGTAALYKAAWQPQAAMEEREGRASYWIRITCKRIEDMDELSLCRIHLMSQGEGICPEIIVAGGTEQETREYLPFGEQMGLYEEVYFASRQALSQKGARISLKFRMNFLKIPSETYGQKEIDWKLIMRREDFIPDPEFDITIAEVVWEYFNGQDWRRLPGSGAYKDIFSPSYGTMGRLVEVAFPCPEDMEPILVQSRHSCYIRARILKMNNVFCWNGQYFPPVLSNTEFSYSYPEPGPVPDMAVTMNNKEKRVYKKETLLDERQILVPFYKIREEHDCVYAGLSHALDRGPVRIFLELLEREPSEEESGLLKLEYFNGQGFRELPALDGTGGFRRSGILTLPGSPDFAKHSLFGKERYWVRIKNTDRRLCPFILSLHKNTTEILAVETKEDVRFFIEPNQKNAAFVLPDKNIHEVKVWVKESREGTAGERKSILADYETREREVENGTKRELWVCWKERESFASSGPEDRHYVIDKNEGILTFSDGIQGKIPDSGQEETIWVRYRCGGGREGNLPAGGIQRMSETVGYINRVTNPRPAFGGSDMEQADSAVLRRSRELRHRGRAVTPNDYEALAMEAAGNIARVKCLPNCTETGAHQPGHITLTVLPEGFGKNQESFEDVKQKCFSYFKDKVPEFLISGDMLHIRRPDLVELIIKAQIYVKDSNQILDTRRRVLENLEQWLNPFTGNFHRRGWEIGEVPNSMKILHLLRRTEGVSQVGGLRILAVISEQGRTREADLEELEEMKFAVAAGGRYEIDMMLGGTAE